MTGGPGVTVTGNGTADSPYVISSALAVQDTDTVDLTLTGSTLSAVTKLSPAAGNLIQATPDGLFLDCEAVADCVTDVTPASVTTVQDSNGIDMAISGAGSVLDPYIVSADTRAVFLQTAAVTFNHALNGLPAAYEDIPELPDLTITVPGTYQVTMEARGNATNPIADTGEVLVSSVAAAIAVNGVMVPDTETMLQHNSQGVAVTDEPPYQLHGTGSCTRYLQLAAGDVISLMGARSSDPGTVTSILSNNMGRCRLSAHRIGA